jgi:hypothetical protein
MKRYPIYLSAFIWFLMLAAAFIEPTRAQTFDVNTVQIVLPSAVRTATTTSTSFGNQSFKGAHVILNITVAPGAQSLTLAINAQDPVSGTVYPILTGTAITTTGINIYKVYPGIGTVANGAASDMLPNLWNVSVTHSGGGSWTYSVGAFLDK